MIIVGCIYNSVISAEHNGFYLRPSGRRLKFNEIIDTIGIIGFSEYIETDKAYDFCMQLNDIQVDLLENKDEVLIKRVDICNFSLSKSDHLSKNLIFVFYNEGWEPKYKQLDSDKMNAIQQKVDLIFQKFDAAMQEMIDKNREDLYGNYDVQEFFLDKKDEYIASFEDVENFIFSTKEGFELYAKNIIPRYDQLRELGVISHEASADYVSALFWDNEKYYPNFTPGKESVWEVWELNEMIQSWYRDVKVGFK